MKQGYLNFLGPFAVTADLEVTHCNNTIGMQELGFGLTEHICYVPDILLLKKRYEISNRAAKLN
jgi:hypothetical protein